jgi:hypothetical protein
MPVIGADIRPAQGAIAAMLREAAALGIAPGLQIRTMAQVWVADACLAPIGLLAAQAASHASVALVLRGVRLGAATY